MGKKLLDFEALKMPWRIVAVVLFLAVCLLNYSYLPVKDTFETDLKTKISHPVQVYYKNKSLPGERFVFGGLIDRRAVEFLDDDIDLVVIKDDCLEALKINDISIKISERVLPCSPFLPSKFLVSDYMMKSSNQFTAVIFNKTLVYGFEIFATYRKLHLIAKIICSVVFLWAVHQLLLRVEKTRVIRLMAFAGFVVAYGYFLYTPYHLRAMDMLGHLENVIHIVRFHEWQKPFEAWQSHHPFFYYTFAAVAYSILEPVSQFPLQSFLGVLALLFFLFYLIMQGKLIKQIFSKKAYGIVMLASAVLPRVVFNSVMIGNSMACLSMNMAAIYFLVRWYQKDKPKDFIWACAFCILGIFTRTSGVIVLAALVTLVLWKKYLKPQKALFPKRWRTKAIILLSLSILAFPATIADNLYYSIERYNGAVLFSNGHTLQRSIPSLIVRNDVVSYLGFDVMDHLTRPFVGGVKEGEALKEYYWNFLLKSALVGEWNYWLRPTLVKSWVEWSVRGMAATQLVIVALFLIGFFSQSKVDIRKNMPLILVLVFSIAASMVFRISYPVIGNGDFRYITFAIIPVYYFALRPPRILKSGKAILMKAGLISICIFSLFSISFFLALALA